MKPKPIILTWKRVEISHDPEELRDSWQGIVDAIREGRERDAAHIRQRKADLHHRLRNLSRRKRKAARAKLVRAGWYRLPDAGRYSPVRKYIHEQINDRTR